MAVSQVVARPVRTGVQLLSAAVVVEFVDAFFLDLTDRQYAAALGLVTVLLGALQVAVEDKTGKAFLRVPPGPKVEAVEDGPANDVGLFRRNEVGAWYESGILIAIACIVVILCGLVWLLQNLG